jgi:hypothetical protein
MIRSAQLSLFVAAQKARRPRVLSLGGGLDSFAMLVRAIQLGEPPDVVTFIDVGAPGDPGEWAGTYRHVREVVMPLCAHHGIEFVCVTRVTCVTSGA